MDESLKASRKANIDRHLRRNKQLTRKGRERSSAETPEGRAAIHLFLKPLAKFITKELVVVPPVANLSEVFGRLDPQTLALITLAPIMDTYFYGLDASDPRSRRRELYQRVGRYLKDRLEFHEIQIAVAIEKQIRKGRPTAEDYLREEWPNSMCVRAGFWLVMAAVRAGFFKLNEKGFPVPARRYAASLKRLHQQLLWAEPYMLPHLAEPPDWIGWRKRYDKRLSVTFVADWRKERQYLIEDRFKTPFPHAEAVNNRKCVPLRINQQMIPVVEKYGLECMGHWGKKKLHDKEKLRADISEARELGDRTFWLDYHCDTRGRMYAVQRFSFDREDHVRSMIEFGHGVRCGEQGQQWLKINAASLFGHGVDKARLADRIGWAQQYEPIIRKIAGDPIGTFELWRKADTPLQFVRACIELGGAWDSPNFVTHLPCGIDATASGLQQLALLGRDGETMELVNLTPVNEVPRDVYTAVGNCVAEILRTDKHPWASWWLKRLGDMGEKRRKLFKGPVSTFAYAATDSRWMWQIADEYAILKRQKAVSEEIPTDKYGKLKKRGKKSAPFYLAERIRQACDVVLPGPSAIMAWLQSVTDLRSQRGLFLEWESASGFPCCNQYEEANTDTVYCSHGDVKSEFTVADGSLPKIDAAKARNSVAANVVHSADAAHAALVINEAARQDIELLTCHDCYYGLAPLMYRVQGIVLGELQRMYRDHDLLRRIYEDSGVSELPPRFLTDEQFNEMLSQLPACTVSFISG